jgi:hypothetical protein
MRIRPARGRRPAGDRGRRRGHDHALHRPRFDARPEHVEGSPDSRLDQLSLNFESVRTPQLHTYHAVQEERFYVCTSGSFAWTFTGAAMRKA